MVLQNLPKFQYAIDITNQFNFRYFFTTTCQKIILLVCLLKLPLPSKFYYNALISPVFWSSRLYGLPEKYNLILLNGHFIFAPTYSE